LDRFPDATSILLVSKKIGAKDAAAYMVAQIIGAVIASALIFYVASNAAGEPNPIAGGFGANGYGEHSHGLYSMGAAMLVEIVLTMFLVLTVLGSTDLKAPVGFAGVAIGLVLTLIHLVGIPITNTSVNPARSIGPAIFVGGWGCSNCGFSSWHHLQGRRLPRWFMARCAFPASPSLLAKQSGR
jgi:aquaporin Z